MGAGKPRVATHGNANTFIIEYGERIIKVTSNPKVRLCSYKRLKNLETIVVPGGKGVKTIEQAEHFISRYRTSKLVKYLFDFQSMKEPVRLMAFDPANAKELSEVQLKLKSFLRTN